MNRNWQFRSDSRAGAEPKEPDADFVPPSQSRELETIIIGSLGFGFVPEGMIVCVIASESAGACRELIRLW